ncbi:MAG: ECF transporter S component [Chloroflexota bacterium]|nr:ECF transporter S component [Chloroflexota bacterium]
MGARRRANGVVLVASLVGLAAFLYPFLLPAFRHGAAPDPGAGAAAAPLVFALVTALCLLAIVAELAGADAVSGASSKTVALLGVLVATDATLRLAPTFLGASPIFPLMLLVGAVYGPALGFQMGALTILLSAFLTGGIGPWLPYQMLGAGWVGLTAGWLPRPANPRLRLLLLAALGALWGFLYGAILNLTLWPFAGAGADTALYWVPGLGFGESLLRYGRFYLATSLVHDLFRAVGNAVILLAIGGPILRVLERFHSRFTWQPWVPEDSPASGQ